MVTEESILNSYAFLRKYNHSIPDETLDFIKDVSLNALKANGIKPLLDDVAQLLEKLPNHLHLARNSEACPTDRWRLYSLVTKSYIEISGAATAIECIIKYLEHEYPKIKL